MPPYGGDGDEGIANGTQQMFYSNPNVLFFSYSLL